MTRGVPPEAVQELLGHATMEMTVRYSHLPPDVKHDAVAVLDKRDANEPERGSHVAAYSLECRK